MKQMSTRKLVLASVMVAITIILAYTPLGLLPIPPINPTILHIPTIIIAILEGPIMGLIVGLGFGLTTLVKAFTMPTMVLDPLFMNPLISVLPRALIGVGAYYVYALLKNLLGKLKAGETIAVTAGAIVGSFINTIGVLGMIYVLYDDVIVEKFSMNAQKFVIAVATTSGVGEAVVAAVATLAVVLALKKVYYRGNK
ncbi:ECF transporter S component [Vallitalea pronyensis]|uniref:ECF transporter S component n=1 Tax=Vallitalea pronyensis TaxID=1348613 RepID=A0A8J8MHU1_9FIRM|nr:ECF transporter S component [Vallitalea pronyensis]QUI21558.1 ECF transporter S component [Vallitalea pronyensis]